MFPVDNNRNKKQTGLNKITFVSAPHSDTINIIEYPTVAYSSALERPCRFLPNHPHLRLKKRPLRCQLHA